MRNQGFTLIELMIAIVIMVAFTYALFTFSTSLTRARQVVEVKVIQEEGFRNALRWLENDVRQAAELDNAGNGVQGLQVLPTDPGNRIQFQIPTDLETNTWSEPITYRVVNRPELNSVGTLIREQDLSTPPDGDFTDANETRIIADHILTSIFALNGEELSVFLLSIYVGPSGHRSSHYSNSVIVLRN